MIIGKKKINVAILDDYQNVSHTFANWDKLSKEIEIEYLKSANFIELSVAKIMDYFNINSSYGDRLKNNLSLINIDGLLSIWQHPS